MTIHTATGDLLSAPAEAVVNTVNTRGVMGKGIALQVKQRWPDVERAYRQACERGEVRLGEMHVVERAALTDGPRVVINFPTKEHWRSKSRLADIELGLRDLRQVIASLDVSSVAIPPLGCGNGGLQWADVLPLIEQGLQGLGDVDIYVYAPEGAPSAVRMEVGTQRPRLTPTLATIVALLHRYWVDAVGITDIEVQKLAYFAGVRLPSLGIRFARGPYGPYCEDLHHVLQRAEGHYLRGYGDRSRRPWEPGPLRVLDGAPDEAASAIAGVPGLRQTIGDVLDLTVGFEGAWGMELLSTVHWVAHESPPAQHPDDARDRISGWSIRKNELFPARDIRVAWERLTEAGWLDRAGQATPTLFD